MRRGLGNLCTVRGSLHAGLAGACSLGLLACWTGPHWPEVPRSAAAKQAPSIAVVSENRAERDAFCRVLRESGRFADVDCSDEPKADATLKLRYVTTKFEHDTGEAIGLGFATVFTCTWFAKVESEQEHRGVLNYQGHETSLVAR